jgi:hypothetical protein
MPPPALDRGETVWASTACTDHRRGQETHEVAGGDPKTLER